MQQNIWIVRPGLYELGKLILWNPMEMVLLVWETLSSLLIYDLFQ